MNIDHFMYAGNDLDDMAAAFQRLTGVMPDQGGKHPTLGTHNRLVGTGSSVYLELIAPDSSSEASSDLRAGIEALRRTRLHRFVMRCASDDFTPLAKAYHNAGIEAPVHDLQRIAQDGQVIRWRLMIPEINPYGLFAPFFIDWLDTPHPSRLLAPNTPMLSCEAGHPQAGKLALLWRDLGVDIPLRLADAPYMHVRLDTPRGEATLT